MSSQTAHIHGDSNITVQASGSGHDINIGRLAQLKLIPPGRQKIIKATRDLDLLIPQTRAVPLTGRDRDKRHLVQWLSSERPTRCVP